MKQPRASPPILIAKFAATKNTGNLHMKASTIMIVPNIGFAPRSTP